MAGTEPQVGERIGPYEIRQVLGRGGMGSVYLAEDHSLDRRVAIKMLPTHLSADSEIVARFQREARALAKVRHPNLMHIYTVGEHVGRPYFAMEYIKGPTLGALIAKAGRFAPAHAVHIVAEVLSALDKVHRAGIIHRDIKPGNIMVDEDGHAVLMDFGLARHESDAALTADHSVIGTPSYMSPEQARGERLDARTDLYSLGIVLYEMLTGSAPFKGKTSFEVLRHQIESSVPAPSQVQPDVPPQLDAVVARAVAKAPEDRYPSARDMAAALVSVSPNATLLQLVESANGTAGPTLRTARVGPQFESTVRVSDPARKRWWRSRWALWVAALLVGAALGWILYLVLRRTPEPVTPGLQGQIVELRRAGSEPIRGRLIEMEPLDDGTMAAKIMSLDGKETRNISIREGDELRVVHGP